jgi:hypothetical protein
MSSSLQIYALSALAKLAFLYGFIAANRGVTVVASVSSFCSVSFFSYPWAVFSWVGVHEVMSTYLECPFFLSASPAQHRFWADCSTSQFKNYVITVKVKDN